MTAALGSSRHQQQQLPESGQRPPLSCWLATSFHFCHRSVRADARVQLLGGRCLRTHVVPCARESTSTGPPSLNGWKPYCGKSSLFVTSLCSTELGSIRLSDSELAVKLTMASSLLWNIIVGGNFATPDAMIGLPSIGPKKSTSTLTFPAALEAM